MTSQPLLEFRHASVDYVTSSSTVSAVTDVTLTLAAGETFGLVGESGCGKTTLSMALMGLLPAAARIGGEILFRGTDLTALTEPARRELRGSQIMLLRSRIEMQRVRDTDDGPVGQEVDREIYSNDSDQRWRPDYCYC